VNQLIKVS